MIQWMSKKIAARRDESGFTLIELLVVIIILGVLSAVVVFAVRGTGDKGAGAAYATDYKTIKTAQEAFCAQNGHYAADQDALVAAKFLSEKGTYHNIQTAGITGTCGDGTKGPNGYLITCDATQAGCNAASGAVPTGGLIRVAGGTAVSGTDFLNPAVTSGGTVHGNTEYMFNGLMRWGENNTPQPDLAQSYTISPDQKTATFVLRPGMTWHDGTPILPSDVEFSFQEALLRFHGRTAASIGPALGVTGEGITAVTPASAITTGAATSGNGGSVTFNFQYSYAPLLKQMNVTEAPLLPEVVYGPCKYDGGGPGSDNIDKDTCAPNNPGLANGGDLIAANAPRHIGSGPFMLKSRNTTTGALVFVKRTGYHFPGLPLANELNQVPTSNAANSLIANSIDVGSPPNDRILPIVAPQTSADITPANGYTIVQPPRGTGGGNCILTQGFNLWPKNMTPATINAKPANAPYEHPIFGDPTVVPANPDPVNGHPAMARGLLVRTALFMATNRQALFDANQFGKGALATSPFHSKVPGYTPTTLPAYDTAKAAQWLTDAGWIVPATGTGPRTSDHAFGTLNVGDPLVIDLLSGTGSQNTYKNQIRTQWAADPIRVSISTTYFASGEANGNFGLHAASRDYDMITVSYCNGDDPVIGVRRQYYAATSPGATAGSQIGGTAFTNTAGYRRSSMDSLWDQAAQTSSAATHAGIQTEAAANVPYIWLDESRGSRAWRTAKCSGFNNNNTGLYVETASCTT